MGAGSLGLDPTATTGTDPFESCNKINLHTHTGNAGEGDRIDSQYVINTPAGDITATDTQAAIAELNVLANLGRVHVPVRQTVLHGLTDAVVGTPNFLQLGTGLAVDLAATTTPLVIAFAYNFSSDFGALDYIGKVTADVTGAWSALPANQTCYLYVDRNISTGALTYGYSLFIPTYQALAPSAPSTDQHWFCLNDFYMKRYSGAAWENKQRVFVGECVTGASSVTSVICYALCGTYNSGYFVVNVNSTYSKDHNIGCFGELESVLFWSQSTTANLDYVVNAYATNGGTVGLFRNRATILSGSSYIILQPGISQTSGYYKLVVRRRF